MKSEKGVIEIFTIGIVVILLIILFTAIGTEIKEENDYGAKEGQVINKDYSNGFYVVSYNNINIGFVKSVNGILKNHYPKGLRINYT